MSKPKNQLVSKLFDALKKKEISVLKFSRQTGIPHDRIYKWEKDGTTPKAVDLDKIKGWLSKNGLDVFPNSTANEDEAAYGIESNLSSASLLNLTASNKILAESNKILAEANKKLADNTIMLTAAVTANVPSGTSLDVLATLEAIREYATELGAELRDTTHQEAAAELGTKMVQQKKKYEKRGSPSALDK